MRAKILSLNVGGPAPLEWNGRAIVSSMLKKPIAGPLIVHRDRVEGDSFANPNFHGTMDSVLYAYSLPSVMEFLKRIGRDSYEPGALGENLTLDQLDEFEVSVGDTFQVGEVVVQASLPRIPCAKVDLRMQHAEGRVQMEKSGRSGVYLRVLTPGKIKMGDEFVRLTQAKVQLKISDVYRRIVNKERVSEKDLELARANGALPARFIEKWSAQV